MGIQMPMPLCKISDLPRLLSSARIPKSSTRIPMPLTAQLLPPRLLPPPPPPLYPPQQSPSQQPIHHGNNPQHRQIQPRIRIQPIQAQHLLSTLNRALPVRQFLVLGTREYDAGEGVRRKVADHVAQGREVVNTFEEGGHVDGHHARHDLGDGEENGG